MLAWVVRADRAGGKAGVSLAALGIPVFEAYIAWYAKRRLIGPIDPALTKSCPPRSFMSDRVASRFLASGCDAIVPRTGLG